ncbi:MAG TPA: gamma-glutamylcyclotransferase [Gammaproteobacteria bacterium]|nr:gamma-glutamylcyclotransferase [Gammaproteobacteria bacterium]
MRAKGQRLFCYGTLLSPVVLARVAGRRFLGRPARLPGYELRSVRGTPYPALRPCPGAVTEGVLYEGLRAAHLRRLDAYEGVLYRRRRVRLGSGRRAWVYVISPRHRKRLGSPGWGGAVFARRGLKARPGRLETSAGGRPIFSEDRRLAAVRNG